MCDNLVNNESEIQRILSIPIESDDEFADIGLSDDENFELPELFENDDRILNETIDDADNILNYPVYFSEENITNFGSSTSQSPIVIQIPSDVQSLPTESVSPSSSFVSQIPISRNRRSTRKLIASNNSKTKNIPKIKKLDPIWRKGNFSQNLEFIKFFGEKPMPDEIKEMKSPKEFFSYFFDNELLAHIAEQSTLYSTQQNPEKPNKITINDVRHFLGIITMMSIVHLPNTRSYWSENTHNKIIRNCMSVNVFENIRRYMHFNDNTLDLPRDNPNRDRVFKVRPLIDTLNKKFSSVPIEENLSLDEQLCPTKAVSYLKQYLPLKPHKWGYKLFVLCGVSGYGYNFEIYTGNENKEDERIIHNEPDFGATGNIVVRMTRMVPENVHHKLFFDNYYTSLPVMIYLEKKGIHTVGTFRRNRFPNVCLTDDRLLMKKDRGYSEECFTVVEDVPISAVAWKDNKVVHVSSTFVGELEKNVVSRFDKKKKTTVIVPRPKIIEVYNKHMGGVDLMDSMIGRYRIIMRSKKWYMKIFYHLVDMSIVNAWILYKKVTKKPMKLAQFREQLAVELCQTEMEIKKKGRKTKESLEKQMLEELEKRKKRTPTAIIPSTHLRLDGHQHRIQFEKIRRVCKLPKCKFQSFAKCTKCDVFLCCNKERNCFDLFHYT
ncbi:piggyBac transposable element-derived protein 3-like isoform X1 [Metopolophium dirhodum]|uniref:piggyBac transposable element-derived protein 3-like n=1 Tax=Metopolophium dirhodum TaxID=44670 RepID=UPI00298F658A|nr:piggyBac transposable element-derived protein 3-like [Metopolophium dirhodum]XP_060862778.1 piggyBac transposable element-derived protein 3-like isoform X1 [Metopolophium dirhodum]